MKVDRRSFFAGAAALGATAHVADLVDVSRDAPSFLPGGEGKVVALREYDHVVVGGGFAGVAAALASARAGAKTCLIERTNVLGGLSTQGHIIVFMPLCDGYGRQVTFGIPEELLRLPMKYSAAKPNGAWVDKKGTKAELSAARYELVFDPGPMMLGLERALVDAGVDIFYDCSVDKVLINGPCLAQLFAHCGAQCLAFRANAFTDATGSATLARLCGAATVGGRAGNIPCGWYYVVDGERRVSLRCGAGKTMKKLDSAAARDYAGDDADERSRHAITSRRAILLDIEEENKRRAALGQEPLHVFSIPTYPTLLKLARVAGEGATGAIVGIFSDWRRKGPVYPLRFGQLLVPGVSNLLTAGRCIACADDMWDVVRCLPACCVSGQAAGTAAALLAKGGSFESLDGEELRKRLVASGVRLDAELLKPDPEWKGGGEMREEGIF